MDIRDIVIGAMVIILPMAIMALVAALPILYRNDDGAGWPGCLTGLILLVVYVLANLDKLDEPLISLDAILSDLRLDLKSFASGAVIGFILLPAWEWLEQRKLGGLPGMLVSFAGLWMLFSYLFDAAMRLPLLFLSLGLAFGIMLRSSFIAGYRGGL